MAKRVNEQEVGPDKGGMRILYVELNGSNASLQEGLRTLVSAMNKPVLIAPPAPRRLIANQTAAQEPEPGLFNQQPGNADVEVVEQVEESEAASNGTTRRPRGEGPKKDRNAGLSIVKSLNLQPNGKQSLKEFVAEKKPQTQMEHIAVYVYYMKNTIAESIVGFDHVFTCFKETGERMPLDVPQTCRNVANQKGWLDTADQSDLKITTHGINLVEKDMPRADGTRGAGTK